MIPSQKDSSEGRERVLKYFSLMSRVTGLRKTVSEAMYQVVVSKEVRTCQMFSFINHCCDAVKDNSPTPSFMQ